MFDINYYAQPESFLTAFDPAQRVWLADNCPSIRYLLLDRGSLIPIVVTPAGSALNYVVCVKEQSFTINRRVAKRLASETTLDGIMTVVKEFFPKHANPWFGSTLWLFYHALVTDFENVKVVSVPEHPNCKVVDLSEWSIKVARKPTHS